MTQTTAAQNPVTPTSPLGNSTAHEPAPSGKHRIYNLIILDESGSMQSIKKATIDGFNETLQTIQHAEREHTDQQHFVALVPFNTCRPPVQFDLRSTATLPLLTGESYQPDCGTPLYDAIGFGISKLSDVIGRQGGTYNVLVTILTDGAENASVTYSGRQIKTMIETLKPLGWTFTYIGANHDVEQAAESLSIHSRMTFEANDAGLSSSMSKDKMSRLTYYRNIAESRSSGKPMPNPDADFFADEDKG